MKPQDLKLSRYDLLLLFYYYLREPTSFPLFSEAIRLIRTGENLQVVLQKKFGLTPKDFENLRQFHGPEEDFPKFLTQLNQRGFISTEEMQAFTTPNTSPQTSPWGLIAIVGVVLVSGIYFFQGSPSEDSHETTEISSEKDPSSGHSDTPKETPKETPKNSAENIGETFQKGSLLLKEKRYEEAYPYLKKVIDLEDASESYYIEKITACFLLHKLEWGEHFATQALQRKGESAALFKIWGQILFAQEKTVEGLAHLEKSLSLEKKDPDILMLLAENYGKLAQHEKALVYLQQFLQLYPADPTALKILARIQMAQGKNEEAMQQLEKISQNEEELDIELLSLLADHYRKKGQLDRAQKSIEKALQQKPQDSQLLNLSGEILEQSGQIEEAMAQFESACKQDPENMRAQLNRAALFQIQKKEEEALQIYQDCLTLHPNLELARYNRFVLWMKQEKKEEALKDIAYLEKHFPHHPLTVQALHVLGAYWYSEKEYEQAQSNFEKILRIQNKDEEALLRHGMCALKQKQYNFVVDDFEYLLQLNPNHPKKALLEQILYSLETSKE